jgi:hypothetical protein
MHGNKKKSYFHTKDFKNNEVFSTSGPRILTGKCHSGQTFFHIRTRWPIVNTPLALWKKRQKNTFFQFLTFFIIFPDMKTKGSFFSKNQEEKCALKIEQNEIEIKSYFFDFKGKTVQK